MNAANDKADDLAVEKGRKSPRRGSKLRGEGEGGGGEAGRRRSATKTRRGKRGGERRPTTARGGGWCSSGSTYVKVRTETAIPGIP